MSFVSIKDSNLIPEGASVSFGETNFVCRQKGGTETLISAADIVHMNRLRAKKIDASVNGRPFQNYFYGGPLLALFMEIFGFAAKKKTTANTRLVLKFKDDGYLIGQTDQETFFKIQNAWLDSK